MLRHVLAAAVLCAPVQALSATVQIESGPIWVKPGENPAPGGGPVPFKLTGVALDSSITWISGKNITDKQEHAVTEKTEAKFVHDEPGQIGSRTFEGLEKKDGPGPRGSTTFTSGKGQSQAEFTPEGMQASAEITLTAIGNLGKVPDKGNQPVEVNYLARMTGKDPLIVKGAQLLAAGLAEGAADVFFAFALRALDIGTAVPGLGQYSSASADWALVAGGVTTPVLSVLFDAEGKATVTGAPGVSLFLLDALNSPPPDDPSETVSLSSIGALLSADILPDGRLDTPRVFGALLRNAFSFNADDPGGEAFRITGDGTATEPASKIGHVPLPAAAFGLLMGLAALGLAGRRRA